MPLAPNVRDPSEGFLGVDEIKRLPISQVRPVLPADLEELASLVGGLDDLAAVVDGQGHLLFQVHVQTGGETRDGLFGVEAVRRGDDHRVEVLLPDEHVPVIDIVIDRVLVLSQQLGRVNPAVVPDVAHRLELQARQLHAVEYQLTPVVARADDGDVKPLGLVGPVLRFRRRLTEQRRRRRRDNARRAGRP